MEIVKAIEILFELFGHVYEGSDLDRDHALSLGIEALKRIKEQRALEACERRYLLPGETEARNHESSCCECISLWNESG